MKVDFSGYVTKNDILCTDGRKIRRDAFKHNDGNVVPMVWQHCQNDPENILGKVYLENREDGVYGYGVFNNNRKAQASKELVLHGDITAMSIHANKLVERNGEVYHGDILEVSLVTRGANPGARIENVSIAHGDGTYTDIDDEAVVHGIGEIDNFGDDDYHIDMYHEDGTRIDDGDEPEEEISHADSEEDASEKSVEDIFNTLTAEQKDAVYAIVGAAVAEAENNNVKHSDEGGNDMRQNAFETQGPVKTGGELVHADTIRKVAETTFMDCRNNKTSFKDALKHAAAEYGIDKIETLFPDAKAVSNTPEFVKRRTEWVSKVMGGTKHTPFSRIKSVFADITADEARARGYLKGGKKIEEVFPVMSRVTTPQTVYKKQKLDHDDIIDITDFDVVAWLRAEMRIMLEEELARAILIGDGRLVTSPDKIKEEHIRPIWTDDDFYSYKLQIPAADAANLNILADNFVKSRLHYEGSGRPVTFMAPETVTDLMLQRNKDDERLYKTEAELADALRVSGIVEVPLFYNQIRTDSAGKKWALKAIIVNLSDYTIGADRGGEITNFDDFDIDYNQYKYLIETRISGALTGHHSAVVIETEVVDARSVAAK